MSDSLWDNIKYTMSVALKDEAMRNLIASAGAGLAGRICCHPIDTIKAQLQAGSGLKFTSANFNMKALYRGLGVTLVGGVPATAVYLNTYDYAKNHMLKQSSVSSQFAISMTAGMIAETLSCLIFVPVDVIKERMQVQGLQAGRNGIYYRDTVDAIKQISKTEGFLRGFYKGYNATLLSFGPFSAIYFAFYEAFKPIAAQYFGKHNTKEHTETFGSNLIASAVAGAGSSWLTNPLDLAKLRLQIARMSDVELSAEAAGLNMHSTRGMLTYVFRREGFRGLYKGAMARMLFHAPHTAVTVVAFDELKRLLN